jgi:myo-inositol 2-dehydrogenase / D-chiro-inositol 1-dehydrogenase
MAVRYGIIGSGMMGQEHIRNLALLEDVEVVAVADPDDGMRAAAEFIAGPECNGYSDHSSMLAAESLDALVIAAPNHLHHAILLDVLDTDLPIMVEKPLGISMQQCADIARRAVRRTAPIWVAMEYRYMPPVARLIDEVAKGTAGRLRMISIREHRFPFLVKVGNWNRFADQTGGTLVEKCCHFFDLMCLVASSEPVRVYASGAMDVNFVDEEIDGRRPDILDNAFVIVDFANGVRAMLDLCMFAEGSYWQEVISATGDRARIDAMVPGPARFSVDGRERASEVVISPRDSKRELREVIHVDDVVLAAGDHHGSTFFQHQNFLRMIREGGKPEVGLLEGLVSVAVGAAAEESVRTGLPVSLPTFRME